MPEDVKALQIMADPPVNALAHVIMIAVAQAHGVTPANPVQVDLKTVMEAVMMVHAAMLDVHPEVKTEADIDEAADDAAAMIRQMIRVCRQYHADTGTHLLAMMGMGASDPVMRQPDAAPSVQ